MSEIKWHATTLKDVLVVKYGMDDKHNPTAPCACGRLVQSDCLVDITILNIGIRKALGVEHVEFLCDGCQTRLFRELHIAEGEFYKLLGAPPDVVDLHSSRDAAHQMGCELRPPAFRPKHPLITAALLSGMALDDIEILSPIPLKRRVWTAEDAARYINRDPDSGIGFAHFP